MSKKNRREISIQEFKQEASINPIRLVPNGEDSDVASLKQILENVPDDATVSTEGIFITPKGYNEEEYCKQPTNDTRQHEREFIEDVMNNVGIDSMNCPIDNNGEPTDTELNWEMDNLHPYVGLMTENIRFNNEDIAQYCSTMAYNTAKTVLEYLTQSQAHMADAIHRAEMCKIIDKK